MNLNKNSWHYKFNKFTYGEVYADYSNNLCPYFWGTLLAFIIFPLVCLGKLSTYIYNKRVEKQLLNPKTYRPPRISQEAGDKIIIGFLLFFGGCGLYALIHGLLSELHKTLIVLAIIGGITGATVTCIFIGNKIQDWEEGRPKREREPNIFIESAKAWKDKHCPMIKWNES